MTQKTPKATICLWYDHDAEDAARQRVFTAMMGMRNIDIAAIEAAKRG
jgi:predicted 3-demethylubiquinone-9 3-methyltransferase (glyoxalase superfamily)